MLQTYIFYKSDLDGQAACTKTAFAVDELLQGVRREQVLSMQTSITHTVIDGCPLVACTVTVVLDLPEPVEF